MLDQATTITVFGDPDAGVRGVILGAGTPGSGPVTADAGAVHLIDAEPQESAHELLIAPVAAAAASADSASSLELCHVTGVLRTGERGRSLHWAGVRALSAPDGGGLRLVCAWFARGEVALRSARPVKAAGHDRDDVAAVIAGEVPGPRIFDPRLSATYGTGGVPRRVGLELWIGTEDDDDSHSRRLAAEPTGASAALEAAGVTVHALTCHLTGGAEGRGAYLLAGAR